MASDQAGTHDLVTKGADAHGAVSPSPEHEQLEDAPSTASADPAWLGQRPASGLPPGQGFVASRDALLLRLQRSIGNRAVQRLLQRQAATQASERMISRDAAAGQPLAPGASFASVQRQGEPPEGQVDVSNLTHEQLFGMSLEEEQALSGTRATSSAAQLQRSASSSSIPGALAEWQRQDGVEGQPSGRALQRTLAVQRQVEAPVISAWAIVGSLGWNVLNGTLTQAGDIGYSFDEMEGTKFPNDDKDAFRTRHKYNITSGRQEIDVWEGTASFKKIGIKFAINYEHDGYSVSSISMSLLDTYDWPLWSGTVAVNITPLRGLAGDASKVRISINVQWSRTFTGGGDSAEYELTGANALNFVRRSSNELFVRP